MNATALAAAAALAAGILLAGPARAVTVDIDITREGEPVPGITITLETPDGTEIPTGDLALELDDPDEATATSPQETAAEEEPPASVAEEEVDEPPVTATAEDAPAEVPSGRIALVVPDDAVGRDLLLVLREDGKVVKREPVRIVPDQPALAIEAYDPADARLSLEITQDKACRAGETCRFDVHLRNDGSGIYTGPLFLTGTLHGTVADGSELDCLPSGAGRHLCHGNVALEPGTTLSRRLDLRLPRGLSRRAPNCLEIARLDEGPAGRADPLVRAVQMALATPGNDVGRPDGILGPRTQAAVDAYRETQGLDPEVGLDEVYAALYGAPPRRLARLGLGTARHCAAVALVAEPKPQPQPRTVRSVDPKPRKAKEAVETSAQRRQARRQRSVDPADILDNPAVRIGIGIGLGSFGRQRDHHRRERRRVREVEEERYRD